jgi:dihydropteroate synthase
MLVMGIVNATPDSFSDGGAHDPTAHALALIAEGADWIDIGGESTRPGSRPVSESIELARVITVIEAVRSSGFANISIDTRKPSVARAAVAAGAAMWNDVGALREPGAKHACADLGCAIVLMHMLGEPLTMQVGPRYDDVVSEVADYLQARAEAAIAVGVARERIWLDPGIGFGKTAAHNLDLLANLGRFVALGFPVLLGASRKGFMKTAAPFAETAADRLAGSLAIALHAARAGVAMIRVHDVAETAQALAVASAIEGRRG